MGLFKKLKMELYLNVLVSIGLSRVDRDILNEYCFNKNITNIFELLGDHHFKNGRKIQIYHLKGLTPQCVMWLRALVGITFYHSVNQKHKTAIVINAKMAGNNYF